MQWSQSELRPPGPRRDGCFRLEDEGLEALRLHLDSNASIEAAVATVKALDRRVGVISLIQGMHERIPVQNQMAP